MLMFLIYPYWNINRTYLRWLRNILGSFLIYPYWNINVWMQDDDGVTFKVSNLSILEYKYA